MVFQSVPQQLINSVSLYMIVPWSSGLLERWTWLLLICTVFHRVLHSRLLLKLGCVFKNSKPISCFESYPIGSWQFAHFDGFMFTYAYCKRLSPWRIGSLTIVLSAVYKWLAKCNFHRWLCIVQSERRPQLGAADILNSGCSSSGPEAELPLSKYRCLPTQALTSCFTGQLDTSSTLLQIGVILGRHAFMHKKSVYTKVMTKKKNAISSEYYCFVPTPVVPWTHCVAVFRHSAAPSFGKDLGKELRQRAGINIKLKFLAGPAENCTCWGETLARQSTSETNCLRNISTFYHGLHVVAARIKELQMIQRRAIQFVNNRHSSSDSNPNAPSSRAFQLGTKHNVSNFFGPHLVTKLALQTIWFYQMLVVVTLSALNTWWSITSGPTPCRILSSLKPVITACHRQLSTATPSFLLASPSSIASHQCVYFFLLMYWECIHVCMNCSPPCCCC